MDSVVALKILFVSVFLFWTLYNLPAFFVGLKRYMKMRKRGDDPPNDYQPKVSIIVPVKNEEKVIERLLKALVNLSYPKREIIIVEDGSTDKTHQICKRYEESHPSLIKFYHKNPSHGKPSAINYAAKRATGEIIAVYDADTVIEPDVLERIVPHFKGPKTGAVQGELYAVNPDENIITRLSVLGDFIAKIQQLGKEKLGLFVSCQGTHQYFRRKVLEELDYWDPKALLEDLELSVRLTKRGYKVKYVPIRAGVEAPAKIGTFTRQHLRWFRGYIQATRKHLNLLKSLNRKSFDAQLTLLLPTMLTLSLLGYALGIYGAINPAAGSQVEQAIGTILLLLSLSAPIAIVVANPKSTIYAPLLYLNWALMAAISALAHLHALLRRPLEWTKTEKSGNIASCARLLLRTRTVMIEEHRNKFSVLIPTYNESENLPALIKSLENNLSQWEFEVVFIDDNSPDGTAERIRELSISYGNFKLLVRPEKMGLGSAYKDGFKVSSGDLIIEMDADLSHNPKELAKLFKALDYADVAIGSRCVPGGRVVGWKWHRRLISRGANLLASLVLGLDVRDATSGFRAYTRRAFEEVASKSTMNGFEFQVEALYIAKKLGLKVVEVPITFSDRKRGKSKLSPKDIVNFAKTTLKMRLR